ncbi:uncharacterized protein AMSG_12426 [Thecamonas trahens ATCC 50062]|uniref:F-box/LRR-repeat protein 15-like leucin rich repeat domain-containing protein n=1 Tax=Thecamonas trahens ATCC 50062 TaxID=461836 RepID=A0A0L0DTZ5_THETB|nr:hypothetical protein AMSG_12426 [Thecamonas trahens ATCC 50062]KNC55804.1 hypothetical protein AMSG_12426 [Thecamonas trahens ATCC 50062]|eukprot:XP_013752840.1 hypothetical protein AMSG_12426 [Thecamonas trahens ATCC 50062]
MAMVVVEMCPNLTSLGLNGCSNITDAAVVALAGGCPNLTTLNLYNCSNITDAAVVALAGGCPNLTFLGLENCSNITDAAVVALAGGCPNLTTLNLSSCSNITDAAVVAVADGCPKLTSLILRSCTKLTDAAVVAVAGGCPNLTTLSLYNCSNITDAAVVALAGGCPNLTTLNLNNCSKVTLDLRRARTTIAQPDFPASQHARALLGFAQAHVPHPVHLMARCNALSVDALNTLLANGADLYDLDDDNKHVYVHSPASSAPVFVGLMIESLRANADGATKLANGINKATVALFVTLRASPTVPISADIVSELITAGADVNAVEPTFNTPVIHVAAANTEHGALKALLEAVAALDVVLDQSAVDGNSATVLDTIIAANQLTAERMAELGGVGLDPFMLQPDNTHVYVAAPVERSAAFSSAMVAWIREHGDGATELANGINKATVALFVVLRASPTVPISADIVSELITAGADVNAVEPTFNTPVIHVAAANTEHGALKALLEAVAALDVVLDQSAVDGNGATVLDTIIAANQLTAERMAELGGVGLDPFTLQPDNTHVYVAAPVERSAVFSSAMVAWIREHGDGATELTSGINKATLALVIVLHAADTIPFSIPVFAFLINSGAGINALEPSLGLRPLHVAVSLSNIPATMALLAAGADLWALGANGETAFSIASAVLNKPGSDTNAAAKEVYNLIVGTSSIPERVADHVRETIAAGGDIGGGAGASAGTSTRVDKLEAKLADTKAELADTKADFADTKAELADTKAELADVRDHVTIATGNIAALQADRANILQHVDKAIAIFQARRYAHTAAGTSSAGDAMPQ